MATPLFYNQGDQNIYKDFQYVPQEKYRTGFTAPTTTPIAAPVSGGITNTDAFTNSGGNDFNPAGNAFGYGTPVSEVNVRTFNPQKLPGANPLLLDNSASFKRSFDPSTNEYVGGVNMAQAGMAIPGGQVQNMYNIAQETMNQKGANAMSSVFPDYTAKEVARLANNNIQDYRQNYQANYNSPYEDSMELPYQGTLGNNEMYPSEKYPNSFMKGKLNRFKNTAGNAAKFVGELLPFPLNVATKLLPERDDNGIGGGTYGIGGLSDDKKAAYNALAKNSMLFDGQQGFKTSTGKNFQAKNYVPNQIEIYNQMTEQGYKLDEDGNVIDPKTNKVIGKNKNYKKRKFLEASTIYKTNKAEKDKVNKKNAEDATDDTTTSGTTNSDGFTYDTNTTGQASSNQYGTYTPSVTPQQAQDNQDRGRGQQDTESQTNSQAGEGGFYDYARGGRAGYFFGGRVGFKNGGLASIL